MFATEDLYEVAGTLRDPPRLVPGTRLSSRGDIYPHGFAMLTLGDGARATQAEYYLDVDGRAEVTYREEID